MAVPAGTIIEVGLQGKLFEQRVLNVMHYEVIQVSTTVDYLDEMGQLAGVFGDIGVGSFGAAYLACMPTGYTWDYVTTQSVFPTRLKKVQIGIGEPGVAGATTTANVSQSVTTTTIKAGRDQVGGRRLPLATSQSASGQLTVEAFGNLGLLADQMETTIEEPVGGGRYRPVIFHRNPAANPRFDRIIEVLPQRTTRVVRRRTVGLGI